MPLSVSQVIETIVASGLLTAEAVSGYMSQFATQQQPGDGEQLLQELLANGKLTPFQAEQLLADNPAPLVLGNYVLLDSIGRGGMGVVYKACHRRMDRIVALKVLSQDAVKTPTLVERFHREVKAVARLHHPNIVAAFDADEYRGHHFLVMEYVQGLDLVKIIQRRHPLPVANAVDFVIQAARGLSYAHNHGLIHRDIKPGNLLLTDEGVVKILDLGLVRFEGPIGEVIVEELTSSGLVIGTVDYMSPEQAEDTRQADARSDIYSLGCTLFTLLAGRIPFPAETVMKRLLKHRESPVPDLTSIRDNIPIELNGIIGRMLAKAPADRYSSMTEVISALSGVPLPQSITEMDLHRSNITLAGDSTGTIQNPTSVIPSIGAPDAITADYVVSTVATQQAGAKSTVVLAGTSIRSTNDSNAIAMTSLIEPSSTLQPTSSRSRWYWVGGVLAVCLGLTVFVLTREAAKPELAVQPTQTVHSTVLHVDHKVDQSVNLIPLLNGVVMGDGDIADVKAAGNVLTLNATERSPQLWLNFSGVRAEHLAFRTRIKIDPASYERDGFLKLVSMDGPECLGMLIRSEGGLRFELRARSEEGAIATAPVPEGFGRDFSEMTFRLIGDQLQLETDGRVLLQVPRIAKSSGYVAIAVSGWRVDVERPSVEMIEPSLETPSSPEPRWIDLLPRLRDQTLPDGWSWQNDRLQSNPLILTDNLPITRVNSSFYCVDAEVTPSNADDAFYIVLPVGQSVCLFGVNTYPADGSALAGIAYVEGKPIRDNPTRSKHRKLVRENRHRVCVAVGVVDDQVAIVGSLNGHRVSTYVGPIAALSLGSENFYWPDARSVGVGTVLSGYTVHTVKLLEMVKP